MIKKASAPGVSRVHLLLYPAAHSPKSWNSEKHAYGWFNGEGDYYVLYFNVQDGNEYYTAATFSSSVRGDS